MGKDDVGSALLNRPNFEHNTENCQKCMQTLPATRSRMYKDDKNGNILGT